MSTASPESTHSNADYDPTFLNSRREAFMILIVWVVIFLWTIIYCHFNGYQENVDPENLDLVLGIPSWVFWGIAAPWLVSVVFSVWFALCYIKDDDLGEDPKQPHEHETTDTTTTDASSASTNAPEEERGDA